MVRPRELAEPHRSRLEALPPSAKLAYLALAYEGPLTQGQVADETELPRRTVRTALKKLEEAELVASELYIPDARKRLFRVDPSADR